MPDALISAYEPQSKEDRAHDWTVALAVTTAVLALVVAVSMVLFSFYVQSMKNDFNDKIAKVREDTAMSTRLNNQGRATVCFLAATRVNDINDLPDICRNPKVTKYYNAVVAQLVSKQRDADALKEVVCLIVPKDNQCKTYGQGS